MNHLQFPPFDLERLLRTVFNPQPKERVAILIDLPDPQAVQDFGFLHDPKLTVQHYAHEIFYQGLHAGGVMKRLGWTGGQFYAYRETGGSNLDLPDQAYDLQGKELNFDRDIYPNFDLFLCISTWSATINAE